MPTEAPLIYAYPAVHQYATGCNNCSHSVTDARGRRWLSWIVLRDQILQQRMISDRLVSRRSSNHDESCNEFSSARLVPGS